MSQIFANTVQRNWTPDLTPCLNFLSYILMTLHPQLKAYVEFSNLTMVTRSGDAAKESQNRPTYWPAPLPAFHLHDEDDEENDCDDLNDDDGDNGDDGDYITVAALTRA